MKGTRLQHLGAGCALAAVLLLCRLFQLQCLQGARWREEALRSRLQTLDLPYQRGRILDRTGAVLAEDRRAWDLVFEYRAFRRSHPAGQLLEAYALMGESPGGLPTCMARAESLLAGALAWTPRDLARLGPEERSDLLFYLRRLGDFRDGEALRAWAEGGGATPLGHAFAGEYARFPERAAAARGALRVLEDALDLPRGRLLALLDEHRLDLEDRIRTLALLQAAGRGAGLTVHEVQDILAAPADGAAGAPPEPGAAPERRRFLERTARRWGLARDPQNLEKLAAMLRGAGAGAEQARQDQGALLGHLQRVSPRDVRGVRRRLVADLHRNRILPLRKDVPYEVVDLVAQLPQRYAGFAVEENPRRAYPGSVAPQVVGLVRAPTEDDLRRTQELQAEAAELARMLERSPAQERRYLELRAALARAVHPGEVRGSFGAEAAWEDVLRGDRGFLQLLDEEATGEPLELAYEPAHAGGEVRLSLDARLQRAAEEAIQRAYERLPAAEGRPRAGLVLLDLRDGSVPVLATSPSFTMEEYRRDYGALARDPAAPLRHRALAGNYAAAATPYPGSTFKLVVAVAALARDPGAWQRVRDCGGSYRPAGAPRPLECAAAHGRLDLHGAIRDSCNVYFYQLAEELGYAAVWGAARELGFGAPAGLDLVSRAPAGISNGVNQLLVRGADTLRDPSAAGPSRLAATQLGIGQAHVTASPLQMARFYGWIATGTLWTPRLVLEAGGVATEPQAREIPLPAGSGPRLTAALRAVVEEGTAASRDHDLAQFRVAGKTGTAQVLEARAAGLPELHGWFAGFFPWDAPRYACAVFCENVGLHGGESATLVLYEFLRSAEARDILFGQP